MAATNNQVKRSMLGQTMRVGRRCVLYTLMIVAAILFSVSSSRPGFAEQERQILPFGDYLAGQHAARVKDLPAARDYYLNVHRTDPDDLVLLEQLFLLEMSNGRLRESAQLARKIVAEQSDYRFGRLILAIEAFTQDKWDEVIAHLDAASENGPVDQITAALIRAWALHGAGRDEQALSTISELTGVSWFPRFSGYHMALLAERMGQTEEARASFEAAYLADSGYFRIVEAYARFLTRQGDRDAAIKLLEKYELRHGEHPIIGNVRQKLAEGEALEPLLSNAREGAGEGFYGIGGALGRDNGDELVLIYLQMARFLNKGSDLIATLIADLFERQKNYQLAIQIYDEVAPTSPLYANAQMRKATSLDALERNQEAEAVLRALVEANPDSGGLAALGDLLRAHERYEEAATIYSEVIAQLPEVTDDDWPLFYFRGICYEREKKWPQAEADLQQALALNPDQPLVLNYLGYSWIDQGRHLKRALNMIKKAVEQRPNDGYIVDSLGWAYYRLNRFDEAVEALEQAVSLRSEDPVINDHLGDAYWRAGRELEARFQWNHARDLDPEPEDLTKILAKLRDGLPALSGAIRGAGAEEAIAIETEADPMAAKASAGSVEEPDLEPQAGPTRQEEGGPASSPADAAPSSSTIPIEQSGPPLADIAITTSIAAEKKMRNHKVERGDTLWDIAEEFYGDGRKYYDILRANHEKLSNPDAIFPGLELVIPVRP